MTASRSCRSRCSTPTASATTARSSTACTAASPAGANVILMAFSSPFRSTALADGHRGRRCDAGVVVVASVGNDGLTAASYPAGYPGVIGVAATNRDDVLASFSNTGASAFIAAPGDEHRDPRRRWRHDRPSTAPPRPRPTWPARRRSCSPTAPHPPAWPAALLNSAADIPGDLGRLDLAAALGASDGTAADDPTGDDSGLAGGRANLPGRRQCRCQPRPVRQRGFDLSYPASGCNETSDGTGCNGNVGATQSPSTSRATPIPYRMRFDNLAIGGSSLPSPSSGTRPRAASTPSTTSPPSIEPSSTRTRAWRTIPGRRRIAPGLPAPLTSRQTSRYDGATPQKPGDFTLFGGTITARGITPVATDFPANDNSRRITIQFTATVPNPVLTWSGHIASRDDWGTNNSAVAITGSPYHIRLIDLDGSGGNQDRSLSAASIILPARSRSSRTPLRTARPPSASRRRPRR